jgi:hypothetical protein
MGSAGAYRWFYWGYRETLVHVRIGTNPDAQVWVNHPGEAIHSGFGRPSYWGGSASIPRCQQKRGLAVLSRAEVYTLQVGLNAYAGELNVQWHSLLAMTVITMIPVMLVFVFLQRFITAGIAGTGLKQGHPWAASRCTISGKALAR